MRVPAMAAAAAALLLAACGGSKSGSNDTTNAAAATPPAATPPAAAPTGTGVTHEIDMVQEGTNSYKFKPDNITIKQGDVVVFKGVSGLQHDVSFYPDSIPPGAADVLNAAIPNKTQPLSTEMISDGSQVSISFAGAPLGVYKFFCIPHQPMGMHGQLTVTQ
ncbi:MAG TPA: plastocyanin/azurin family copper-binding protein [Gemmatimonadales bacterium]